MQRTLDQTKIKIVEATSEQEPKEVRKLVRAFVTWHRNRHLEDLVLTDDWLVFMELNYGR